MRQNSDPERLRLRVGEMLVHGSNRYRLEQRVGHGGFAEVYAAFDEHMGRKVAIKYIFQNLVLEQVRREVELLAKHAQELRFIPEVYNHWHQSGKEPGYVIVMAFIEGPTLKDTLSAPWPVDKVIDFLRILLANLRDLHRLKIQHRDIKPSNIKAVPAPETEVSYLIPYILLDFGVAKYGAKTILGGFTRDFAAPEQYVAAYRHYAIDHRADLFSLAATAYNLLTGKEPLSAQTRSDMLRAESVDPLRSQLLSQHRGDIPQGIEQWLLEMLELDPSRRPADAQIALRRLEDPLQSPPPVEYDQETAEETQVVEPPSQGRSKTTLTLLQPPDAPTVPPKIEPPSTVFEEAVATLGKGRISSFTWLPDAPILMLGSSQGVWRIDPARNSVDLWRRTSSAVHAVYSVLEARSLLVASADRLDILDQTETGAPGRTPAELQAFGQPILIRAGGTILVVVSDNRITALDMETGRERAAWQITPGRNGRVAACSTNGRTLVIGFDDELWAYDLQASLQEPLWSRSNLPQPMYDLALTADGSHVAVATAEATLVWRQDDDKAQRYEHSAGHGQRIALSADGAFLAVAEPTGIKVWRTAEDRLLREFALPTPSEILNLAFCADTRLLAAATVDQLWIWELHSGKRYWTSEHFTQHAVCLAALAGSSDIIALGSELQQIATAGDHLALGARLTESISRPYDLAVSADATNAAILIATQLILYRLSDGAVLQRWPVQAVQRQSICFGDDAAHLFVVGENSIAEYRLQQATPLRELPFRVSGTVDHVALAPHQGWYAVHSGERVVIQSLEDGHECYWLHLRDAELTTLALAPEGNLLALADDTSIMLKHLSDGKAWDMGRAGLDGLAAAEQLSFAPDGSALLSLHGNYLHLWSIQNDELLPRGLIAAHGERIDSVVWTNDGTGIVTASRDGTISLWRLEHKCDNKQAPIEHS
ncbi:MAG: serine/threonine-protein kinase [Chloroflexales bacterium]|nr:serine/threonine-protein kinase [Chloroflexales bacterium]